eukprot:scaffold28631_cov33-Phaeocystis_antarctica.AAC.1
MLVTCSAILRGPATQPRLLWSGCWLSHSDWGWLGWSVARVEMGRPRGLPLLLYTGGQRSASLDQGSAVDGVSLLFALGPR